MFNSNQTVGSMVALHSGCSQSWCESQKALDRNFKLQTTLSGIFPALKTFVSGRDLKQLLQKRHARMEDGEYLAGREDAEAWRRESRFMGVELVKLVGVGEEDAEVERLSRRQMIGCGLR